MPNIAHGDSFQRSRAYDVVETARIIDVATDNFGISHVHFALSVYGPSVVEEEQRTLSLETFHNLYSVPLTA